MGLGGESANLQVGIDGRGAQSGSRVVTRSLDDIERKALKTVSSVENLRRSFAGLALKVTGFLGLSLGFGAMIQSTIAAERALSKMAGMLRATGGASGQTVAGMEALSVALQKVSIYGDDAIQEGMALLLTFRNIGGNTFERTTRAALDMASALGMDLRSAFQTLGRAVNDPTTGLTMLTRIGIRISAPVKDAIDKLISLGKTAEAQNLVLAEMEARFKGMAATVRGNLGGAIEGLKNVIGDLFEMNMLEGASKLTGEIERLNKVLASDEARKAADVIGGILFRGINLAASSVVLLVNNLELLIPPLVAIGTVKAGLLAVNALLKLNALFTAGAGLVPGYTSLISRLGSAFTMFRAVPGFLNGIQAALLALGLTPGGLVLVAVGGLLTLAQALEGTFQAAQERLAGFNAELRNVDLDKLQAVVNATSGGATGIGGWRESVEIARRQEAGMRALGQTDALEMARTDRFKKSDWGVPVVGGGGAGAGKSSGVSAVDKLVTSIRDKMKYLGADGKTFLVTLDAWKAKLKPLSDDWKKIADLSLEIRQNASAMAGQEAAGKIKMIDPSVLNAKQIEKAALSMEDLREAAKDAESGTLDLYKSLNGSGMMSDADYLQIVKDRMEAIRQKYHEMVGEGVSITGLLQGDSNYSTLFGEAQSKMLETATKAMDNLKAQYDNGKIGLGQYEDALESLKNQFAEYPLVVKGVQDSIEALRQSTEASKITVHSLIRDADEALSNKLAGVAGDISDAFANAIVNGENLSDTLKNLAKDIAFLIVKTMILRAIGGLFGVGGGLFGGTSMSGLMGVLHTGGIVGSEGAHRYFSGLPKFHSGGLSNDEQLAVLKRGEGVFTPGQMKALGDGMNGGKGDTTVVNMTVKAIDAKGVSDFFTDNRGRIEGIVVNSVRRAGAVRTAMRGS